MIDCPELAVFEGGALSRELEGHVAACASCQFVIELIEERTGVDPTDECSRFEALLAARADGSLGRAAGKLLARHLASCAGCRAVADTLAPTDDAAGELRTLPEVDPACYELGLEVARGGMGPILAARDLRVGRPVAVKELLGRSPALATRFEREARVTARLQHPGIVPIYEIGRWPDGTPFYAMRMVDGRTLRQAIDAAPTLVERLALLPAVIAATEAVAFAHGQRIIHRDLTPSNVLIGAYGETVVIDWGLAKDLVTRPAADEASMDGEADGEVERTPERLTGLGSVIGTAAYMPPEQAHAVSVDERADVYALGAILYHVLAGRPPYQVSGNDRLLAAVRAGPPPEIRARAPGAPRDLQSIVTKAMARDAADRYPSARELSDELKRFHTGRLVAAHAYTTAERLRRFLHRHRGVVGVLFVASSVLAIVAWLSIARLLDLQSQSDRTARTLLEERGRTEVLAGRPLRALAYLGAAHDPGRSSPALDFLLASALRELDDLEVTLDCDGDVQGTALSPDGLHLAAACTGDGRIWRLSDHQLVHTLRAPDGARDAFQRVSYTDDARTAAFIGKDGVARLYDTTTGALRLSLGHRPGTTLNRASFSPDGTRVVTTGTDGKAVVWDAVSGARLHTLVAGHLGFLSVYGLLAPDGRTLLTATTGGVGTGWDIERGVELGSIDHGAQILGGDLSRVGGLATTCGADRRARVWDLETRTARVTLAGHSDVLWRCVFSPDGTRLLTTSSDGTAKVWDLDGGTLITSVDAGDIVSWGEFSPDGALIATTTLAGSAQVWDAATGALLTSHAFASLYSHFTQDSQRLVMERGDGKIQLWRRPTGRQRDRLAAPPGGELLEVDPTGARAIIARAGQLEIWDVAGGTRVAHQALTPPYALAAGGQRLAARTADGVAVLDLASGATLATSARAGLRTLALDGAGQRLLAGDGAGAPEVIELRTGRTLATLAGAREAILSDDGRRALAWREGAPPVVWDVDAARPLRVLADVDAGFAPVGFSADGRRLALHVGVEGSSRALGVWDTGDGRRVAAVLVASDASRFDPGGTMLTAIGADGLIRALRAEDGALIASFVGERLTSAQIDARGALVVATDRRDAAVSILDARDGRVLAQWPIRHTLSIPTEEGFTLGHNLSWWTPDGAAIVARGVDATVWDAATLTAGARAQLARARRQVPWRVAEGELVPVSASLTGRVTRDGLPVPLARVTVEYRESRPSNQRSWTSTNARARRLTVTTGVDGGYLLRNVPTGDYTLTARSDQLGCASAPIARTIADLEQSNDLELIDCAGAD